MANKAINMLRVEPTQTLLPAPFNTDPVQSPLLTARTAVENSSRCVKCKLKYGGRRLSIRHRA